MINGVCPEREATGRDGQERKVEISIFWLGGKRGFGSKTAFFFLIDPLPFNTTV